VPLDHVAMGDNLYSKAQNLSSIYAKATKTERNQGDYKYYRNNGRRIKYDPFNDSYIFWGHSLMNVFVTTINSDLEVVKFSHTNTIGRLKGTLTTGYFQPRKSDCTYFINKSSFTSIPSFIQDNFDSKNRLNTRVAIVYPHNGSPLMFLGNRKSKELLIYK